MATPRIADQIGRVLGGRYRLVAPIGTGASAHVYVADDVRLNRRVAVKVLHPALADDESFLRRFRAEAQAVAALRHAHIMNVYDWGQDDDGPFLVLEHLGGGSLRDVLDTGYRLSPSQVLQVGLDAARALDHAHRRGLVHRDIKPANLLFDEEGRVAIADFGLARALAEAAWTEPAGAMLGTARYASPEQARGSSVDGKSDVYALALTLVEAATGQVPFAADTTIATLMGRLDRPMAVPDELGPVAPLLRAAGAADPSERIDAGELARRLERTAPELSRPQPIPLPPGVDLPAVGAGRDPDDLTVIGAPAPPVAPPSRPRLYDDEATVASPAVGAATAFAPGAPSEDAAPPRRSTGRVVRRVLIALLVVAALVAGGVVAAGAAKPSYAVPAMRQLTLAEAAQRAKASKGHFHVSEIRGQFFDEDVAKGAVLEQRPLASEKLKEGGTVRVRLSDGPAPRMVPDLTGKTQADAQQALAGERLVAAFASGYSESVPKGTVIDWGPKGSVARDSTVTVTVSQGKQPKPVPSLIDRIYDEGAKILGDLGFIPKREDAFSDTVAKGQVIATKPPTDQPVPPGTEVTIVVSKGPETVAVPDVSGLSIDDAVSKLQDAGFQVGGPYGPPNARRAYSTSPSAGTKAKKGSLVDLFVGR